ncbi:unnamed protein product [Mytilus edulis]|uniref:Uncharacterized protein n=1 Tax=Mytilus edulis TaxID=6550 RepID=A0A8S3S9N6_MYTED|nr:unnamed protein product [Mytilus edulis]
MTQTYLSNRKIDSDEMKVLNKGLKYTPTPPADTDTLSVDIKEFCRKLRLKNHFGDKESKTADESIVRNKSTFTPEKGKNKDLDLYINHLSNFPLIPKPQDKVKNNLPFKQQQALYRLQKDESIIIKEADKGGALVIMDRIYYRDKIQEQLNDKQYYRELNDNMEKKTKRNINKLISKFPHCTTEKEVDYLTKFEVKTSNFYGLPKIHKSKEVETAVQQQNCAYIEINSPKDLKFRPIVAGPQCPTHRLSHFIDLILKPLCQYVPSFIRDNFDFFKSFTSRSQRRCNIGKLRRNKSLHQYTAQTRIRCCKILARVI